MSEQEDPAGPLRVDARRNRDQIVMAAAKLFTERGYDAPLEEVAKRAGVGIGTLYRRFAGREALVGAVAQDALRAVLQRIRTDAETEPRAWDVLLNTVGYSRELRATMRSVTPMPEELRRSLAADPELHALRSELSRELGDVVDRAQREGDLRADVGPGDVLHLLSLLYQSETASRWGGAALERAAVLLLDGLATAGPSLLPGRPVELSDIYLR